MKVVECWLLMKETEMTRIKSYIHSFNTISKRDEKKNIITAKSLVIECVNSASEKIN